MKKLLSILFLLTSFISCKGVLAQCDRNFQSHMGDGYNSKEGLYHDCDSLVGYAINDDGRAYEIWIHDITSPSVVDFQSWFIDAVIYPVVPGHRIVQKYRKICQNGDTSVWTQGYTSNPICAESEPLAGQTFERAQVKTISTLTGTDSIRQGGQAQIFFLSTKAGKGKLHYEGNGFSKTMDMTINKGRNGTNISTLRMATGKLVVWVTVGTEKQMKLIEVK